MGLIILNYLMCSSFPLSCIRSWRNHILKSYWKIEQTNKYKQKYHQNPGQPFLLRKRLSRFDYTNWHRRGLAFFLQFFLYLLLSYHLFLLLFPNWGNFWIDNFLSHIILKSDIVITFELCCFYWSRINCTA